MTGSPEQARRDDDARLEAMVDAWLQGAARGAPPQLTLLCGDRHDLLPQLRALVALARDLPGGEGGDSESNSDTQDPLLGRLLAQRYRLTARLGAGGMGLVYAAHDEQLDREVAVKVLEDLFAGDPARVARFRREAQGLAALDHPHIVSVHDFDLTARPPFLVMDRIVGFDLAALVRALREIVADRLPTAAEVRLAVSRLLRAPAPALDAFFDKPWPQAVAQLGVPMGRALAAAHAVGVVHRDVKPSNFMLDAAARVRLLDFGLARREADAALTRSDARLGTPLYMSPEQVRGEEATVASDVYSLGAALFELLCLQPPFSGQANELETKILYDEPPPPQRLHPRLPRDLGAVCTQALHKTPTRRYASADAVVGDLERFLRFEPVQARARSLPAPLRTLVGTYRRYRAVALVSIALAGLLGCVALLAGHFLGGERERRDAAHALAEQAAVRELHAALSPHLGFAGGRDDRLRDPTRDDQFARLDALTARAPNDTVARFLRLWMRGEEQPPPASVATDRAHLLEQLSAPRCERLLQRVALPVQQRNRNDRAAASAALQQALREFDAEPQPLDALARRLRITVLLQLIETDAETARQHLDDLRTLIATHEQTDGRSAFSCFARAVLAQVDGDLHSAREHLRTCDHLCPNQPSTQLGLARVLRQLGQPSAALPWVQAAVNAFRVPHGNALEQLALCQIAVGDFAGVEATLARLPDDPESRTQGALTRLRLRLRQAALDEDSDARNRHLDDAARAVRTLEDLEQQGTLRGKRAEVARGGAKLVQKLLQDQPASSAEFYFDLLLDRQGSRGADVLDPSLLERLALALRDQMRVNEADLASAIARALRRLEKDGTVLR